MFGRDRFGRSRVKTRRSRGRTFWVWMGVVALALGTQALPGFAQEEEEEDPVQARPAPERKLGVEGVKGHGALSKEALRPAQQEKLAPAAGQQAPSAESMPVPSPKKGNLHQ